MQSKPESFLAKLLPIFPNPIIPIVLPFNSSPLFSSRNHFPCLISLSAFFKLLKSINNIPIACSPTASLFPSGTHKQTIPLSLAYTKSIFSMPAPTLPIHFKFGQFSNNILSILNLLLIIKPS